ncbi:glycoside hydrolase family 3 domain protein [Kribbella flavida DSM 17836]|uniref:beta-N-acetylhexosaminidase n=1 Tax=Kribbella flavida (strain DSM 17836 / JCM 10339 / NBRC 14399) TaxID=479435 RepID=D2PU34_KRIFD|nr:glycoside hydrolase family 3 protein [Kribbella flavida]ADB35085.1 glycoside hydrolase family 3 domain protein [Kribbella flavida DSM 17836]
MSALRRSVLTTLASATAVATVAALVPAAAVAAPPPEPKGQPPITSLQQVATAMKGMSLEEKIGQMFVLFGYGPDAHKPDQRNTNLYGVATPAEVVAKYKPGGWIYFNARDNVQNPTQLATYSNQLQTVATSTGIRVPMTIATDQEQGVVVRIGPPATQFGGNMAHGAARSTADARTAAGITGRELKAMGIRQDYAPVADVNVNALNPVIGVRSFSSDPQLVSDLTVAQVQGYQKDAGIIATAKHFPGHGDTVDDSHTSLPTINHTREQWNTIDAPPFKAAIKAGIDSIMTAHIVIPSLDPSGDPATLSKPIMTGVLRKELGFKGLIITDALEMAAVRAKYGDAEVAVRAIEAGVDQLLLPPAPDVQFRAVVDAVKSGRISERRIDESLMRILLLKLKKGVLFHPFVDPAKVATTVGTPDHLATAQRIVDKSITLVKNNANTLPLSNQARKVLVTGWGVNTTQALANSLTKRGATTTVAQTGAAPTDAAIADAVAKAQANDVTVVLTQKAWDTRVTDKLAKQQKLVKDLLATGKTVIVVAVRDPYDIAYFDQAPTYVATYGYQAVSMESLTKVLYGEIAPAGKLPVDIPVAGQPATALYPFGHGLSW